MNGIDIPEEINVHKQIWGKNAEEVIYGSGEEKIKTMSIGVPCAIQGSMNSDIVPAEVI